ncbi:ribonuclease P protein subunit p38 [Salarias fasciatus]|uniref:Ribosomal protein eL8/eL30/eS12/Gadd45 domain-containing protein n=1 Tax=Salarias fasciatus TaxID=181472 RepID=A0A672GW52_SALFA|nr:ribonuclease P protein subunit p38 [Salarias fasciatus]
MATPRKLAKKEAKKQTPVKTSFTSPFTQQWSPLPQEDMHFILKTVTDKLISAGLEKKEVKVFRPWRKKKEQKAAAAPEPDLQASQDAQEQDPVRNGWTNAVARRQLAIGINEVTKALERNQLKLALVCKSVKPTHMTSHLITLSVTRGVPACQVPRLSQSVSEPLGLKSVLALGFRQCPPTEDEVFTDAVDAIRPRVPPLHVAWLQGAAAEVKPGNVVEGEEKEEGGETRGQKRKVESGSDEVSKSPLPCTLQPLKVKRIVANPAKKRKVKPKK